MCSPLSEGEHGSTMEHEMHARELQPRRVGQGLPRLIVCERKGRWAAALRIHGGMAASEMVETRSLFDCGNELRAHPSSFVVVELLAHNAAAVVEWLVQLDQLDPRARAVVAAHRSLHTWGWAVREAGAVWFVTSPRQVGPVARMARRHLNAVPTAPRDFVEDVWDSLPWARYSGTARRRDT